MSEPGLIREKVISYLSGLSPSARAMLVRKLERSDTDNTLDQQARMILDAARVIEQKQTPVAPVVAAAPALKGDFKSRFFAPFNPFTIEERLSAHQTGWVSRGTLDAIWTYLAREVLPDEFGPMQLPLDQLGFKSEKDAEQAAAELRGQAFAALQKIDRASEDDAKARQRFAARLGGLEAFDDWRDLIVIRERQPALERLFAKLPNHVSSSESAEKLVTETIAIHLKTYPGDAAMVAAGLCGRLSSAAALVRFAVTLAGTAEVAAIRKSPFGAFVDVAISAAECSALHYERLQEDRQAVAAQTDEIRNFHEIVRGATSALSLGDDPFWRARLAHARKTMSEGVTRDIEDILAVLRRALRFDDKSRPSESDAEDGFRAVALLVAARRARESLAVNELLNRISTTTEQAVEMYARDLLDRLRKEPGQHRDLLISITDQVIAMSEQLFGDEHAGLLRRARDKSIGR